MAKIIFLYIPYIYKRFEKHNGWILTSSLAYFVLLSSIPIMLIIITIVSYILPIIVPSYESTTFVSNNIKYFLPMSVNAERIITNVEIILKSKRYLGFISIPVLFWLASLIFDVIEHSLELAFNLKHGRPFWKSKLFHFLLLIFFGAIMMLFALLSTILAFLSKKGYFDIIKAKFASISILGIKILNIQTTTHIINILVSFLLGVGIFYFLYRFVPSKRIKDISILKGAIFSSFGLELAREIFSFYIANINNFRWLFGPITAFAIIIYWAFYASFVFVIGAEVCYLFQKLERRKRIRKKLQT